MRRSITRFTTPIGKSAGLFTASFSSGAGRGRGRGAAVDPLYNFVNNAPGKPIDDSTNVSVPGHGRGGGEARVPGGRVEDSVSDHPTRPDPVGFGRKVPEFIQKIEEEGIDDIVVNRRKRDEEDVRFGLVNVLAGTGRGTIQGGGGGGGSGIGVKKQENRFIKARQENVGKVENVNANVNVNVDANVNANVNVSKRSVRTPGKKFDNPEDAKKNAMEILSRGDGSGGDSGDFGGGDRGERVMESGGRGGGRGRGRGGRGFRGRGGRGGRFGGRERFEEEDNDDDDDDDDGAFIGDPADGEKLAKRLGPETMNQLVEGFEEMSESVLPSVQQDAFIEAMHINYAIECEPEYLFGDFESNPDIDEKPPMTLRECFDKAKPFLMAYENIQSHEEWEEAVEDAMKQVPLMKQIVDYYSGPDRVTAKKQMEELERVAKTLPKSAPDSVKRFTDRAVLSLQSNPGWGFDKKCQFMDKLVWEVSQQYK